MNSKKHFRKLIILVLSISVISCSSNKDAYKGMTEAQIYNQGKANSNKQRFDLAEKDFEALEAKFPYGKYAEKSKLALGHAQYNRGNAEQALATIEHFIKLHPRHKNIDYTYYLKGIVDYDAAFSTIYKIFPIDRSKRDPNHARKAFDDFKLLVDKFPKSKYAADSRQRMIHLRNQLAKNELEVAKHYLQKKAYLASANRAANILTEFDQTKSVPGALAILVKSYKALGMQELAQENLSNLKTNFPKSTELQELKA